MKIAGQSGEDINLFFPIADKRFVNLYATYLNENTTGIMQILRLFFPKGLIVYPMSWVMAFCTISLLIRRSKLRISPGLLYWL